MSIKMLFDHVLVHAAPVKTEEGGILLSAESTTRPASGIVVSVGLGKFTSTGTRIEHGINVGDEVIFSHTALNQPLEHDGETLYVMLAEQIFGVIR